jgi:predicted secreted protein
LGEVSESINTKVGQVFEIKIEGIPTTGFVWDWIPTPESSKLVMVLDKSWSQKDSVTKNNNNFAGATNFQIFQMKALNQGKAILVFQLRRQWEKSAAHAERIFSICIEP